MNSRMLARKFQRMGYYWSTLEADYHAYVRRCHKCQIYANQQPLQPSFISMLTSSWHFSVWGIDTIGRIIPKELEAMNIC